MEGFDFFCSDVDDSTTGEPKLPPPTKDDLEATMRVLAYFDQDVSKLEDFQELKKLGNSVFVGPYFLKKWEEKDKKEVRKKNKAQDKKFIENLTRRNNRFVHLKNLTNPETGQLSLESGSFAIPEISDQNQNIQTVVKTPQEKSFEMDEKELEKTEMAELNHERGCYICKARYTKLHFFYHNQCPDCAEHSWMKRNFSADLTDRVCLVTGGRVKIGFEIVLKLLRAGAFVVVTTRFPNDAAQRFSQVPDFAKFSHLLKIVALDLRDLDAVNNFISQFSKQYQKLDVLINNATQTVRRPPKYYQHLIAQELVPEESLPATLQKLVKWEYGQGDRNFFSEQLLEGKNAFTEVLNEGVEELSQLSLSTPNSTGNSITTANASAKQLPALRSQAHLMASDKQSEKQFPQGLVDVYNQQLDTRSTNSWVMNIEDVPNVEFLEVTTINQLAPSILVSRLFPLFLKSSFEYKHIINVSAQEGKFYRHKTPHHPHTNMAKAAINMLTRTSFASLLPHKITINSVDTGWVDDENPLQVAMTHSEKTGWTPPLDIKEGAARVVDPVWNGKNETGLFLKDYKETEW